MRQEIRLPAGGIEINPVVVPVAAVTIPMGDQQFERHELVKRREVERAGEAFGAQHRVGFLTGRHQPPQIGPIVGAATLIPFQLGIDLLAEPPVVEVSPGMDKVPFEKVPVEALFEHIHSEVAVVQPHAGMGDAWGGQAQIPADRRAEPLAGVALILHRVVEVELPQAMKLLPFQELPHIQREGGFAVEFLITPRRPLELHRHIGERGFPLDGQRAPCIAARFRPQSFELRLGESQGDAVDRVGFEEVVAGVAAGVDLDGRDGRGGDCRAREFGARRRRLSR